MNRRKVLGGTATAALGAALPGPGAFAEPAGPVMQALSAYMGGAAARELPAEAAEHARHHLLDTLASIVSGSELPPGLAAQRHIRAHAGTGTATVVGSALTAAPADAALANGVMAPLDAVEAIRGKRAFAAADVKRATVRLAPSVANVVDNRDIPDICLQHMVAVMLLDGTVSFHAAHDKARMQDPAVLAERAKVSLVPDDELAPLLPVRVTVVEIEFSDGTRIAERVTAVRGTPRNPMSRAEVVDKAAHLVAPVLGAQISQRLIETVLAIEAVTDIRTLRALLTR